MKVRLELQVELDARDLTALVRELQAGTSAPQWNGQQSIDANRALAALVAELRRQVER